VSTVTAVCAMESSSLPDLVRQQLLATSWLLKRGLHVSLAIILLWTDLQVRLIMAAGVAGLAVILLWTDLQYNQ